MSDKVEYELHLKDNFSQPLDEAREHAQGFHESVMHIVEALGLIEAAHEAFDFLKESLSEYEDHAVAVAGLTQMYKNNSDAVGINLEKMKELAEQQQRLAGTDAEDVLRAEQTLLKFREIRIGYEELIPVIGDFAAATGTDAADAANTLGRALENPERAMRLLMQAGVSPQQIQSIQNLQQMGHVAQAQQEIFDVLKQKYQGVAQAMYEANPSAQLHIQMKELKESFGEIEEQLLQKLMPALTAVFEYIHHTIDYLKEHKEAVKEVITVVGILVAGFIAYKTVLIAVNLWEGITAASMLSKNVVMVAVRATSMALAEGMGLLEAAQWGLNFAMDANPIGAVIMALTALVAELYVVIKAYNEANAIINGDNQRSEGFKTESASVVALADRYVKLGLAKEEAMKKAIAFEKNTLFEDAQRLQKLIDSTDDVDKRMALQRKMLNISGQLAALSDQQGLINSYTKTSGVKPSNHDLPPKSDKVAGTSHVTINVTIQKMTGIDKFISTTTKGAQAAGENVVQMLLAAVNQFQAEVET